MVHSLESLTFLATSSHLMPLETLVLMIFSVTSFLFMGRTFYQGGKVRNKQYTFVDTQYLGQGLVQLGSLKF